MALKDTFDFLSELKENNHKEWFDSNRPRYKTIRDEFMGFIGNLIEDIARFDERMTGVDPKKCAFRINRDIRFSKDKSPYKVNFGALMGPEGRKTEGSSYYIHLQPGNTFLGGGIYMPPPDKLSAIRQEIDYNLGALNAIIHEKSFKARFGEIQGDKLKTAPKGYPKDHPAIDLLRLKSFYVVKYFSDQEVLSKGFYQESIKTYQEARKFNEFINIAIGQK